MVTIKRHGRTSASSVGPFDTAVGPNGPAPSEFPLETFVQEPDQSRRLSPASGRWYQKAASSAPERRARTASVSWRYLARSDTTVCIEHDGCVGKSTFARIRTRKQRPVRTILPREFSKTQFVLVGPDRATSRVSEHCDAARYEWGGLAVAIDAEPERRSEQDRRWRTLCSVLSLACLRK
jgi:hypothetical protein